MAATDLARGRNISVKPVPHEITIFMLIKEFGGYPDEWARQSNKDIKALTTILSTFNRVRNAEMERMSKQSKKR